MKLRDWPLIDQLTPVDSQVDRKTTHSHINQLSNWRSFTSLHYRYTHFLLFLMPLHRVFGVITKKNQDHIICLFFAYSTTEDCEIYDPMVRFLRNFPQTTPLSPACPRSQQPRFPQFADLGFGSRDCTTFRTFECVCVCMCVCTSSVRDLS